MGEPSAHRAHLRGGGAEGAPEWRGGGMTATTHWALLPRDGFFCKDGRGWQTSASNRGHGLEWPWPSTVLGACPAASGRREEARRGSVLGRDEWRMYTASLQLGRALVVRRPLG